MEKIILLALFLTGCDGSIQKDHIDIATYICNTTGEDLYEVGYKGFRCGGKEGEWQEMEEAIVREGTACILESQ